MNGRLVIKTTDKQRIEYLFEDDFYGHEYDYTIWIDVPKGRKLDIKQVKIGLNKYFLRKLNGKQYRKDFPDRVELINTAYTEGIDLFDACDKVIIEEPLLDIIPNIQNNNPKKIVIDTEELPLDMKVVESLEEQYNGYENIYVKVEGNDDPITISEYRKTTETIDNIVNKIKSYDLSPLEQMIYAYDYVRDRIYVSEEYGESATVSRDLTKVLLGDKIVCVGYSKILLAIMKKLGIYGAEYSVNTGENHSIVIANIKDEKYNINGIYYFDPTYDRKRDESNEHFNRYIAFANSKWDYGYRFSKEDNTFGKIDNDRYQEIIREIQNEESPYLTRDDLKSISNMSAFIGKRQMNIYPIGGLYSISDIQNNPTILDEAQICWDLLKEQDYIAVLNAIARVRKIRYYENPEMFPYSASAMKKIVDNSYWLTPTYELEETLSNNRERYDKEAKEIDLVKVLRKIKDQKDQQKND